MVHRLARPLFIAAALIAASPIHAAEADKQVEAICYETMELLKAGKYAEAYDASLGKSPLVSSTDRASLVGQIQAGMAIYGKPSAYELLAEHKAGTMAIKRYYLLRQENMVTRWELVLLKTGNGWSTAYFGYDTKAQNWFEEY